MGILSYLLRANDSAILARMQTEAAKIADHVYNLYSELRVAQKAATEEDILLAVLKQTVALKPGTDERMRKNVCLSMESVSYFIARADSSFGNWDDQRFLQFTRFIDAALHARGVTPQPKETHLRALLNRGFPEVHIRQIVFNE